MFSWPCCSGCRALWYWEVFSDGGAKLNGGVARDELRARLYAGDFIHRVSCDFPGLREIAAV